MNRKEKKRRVAATPRHAYEWRVWESVRQSVAGATAAYSFSFREGVRVRGQGIIAHAIAVVEHFKRVAERLMTFARVVGRKRVIAGADCGFAQGAMHQCQHPTVITDTFDVLVEGARLSSEGLWRS